MNQNDIMAAIKFLQAHIDLLEQQHPTNKNAMHEKVVMYDKLAISALEKQVAKKADYPEPTKVKAFDAETEQTYTFPCVPCPVCEKWIVVNPNTKYCSNCGQKLNFGVV